MILAMEAIRRSLGIDQALEAFFPQTNCLISQAFMFSDEKQRMARHKSEYSKVLVIEPEPLLQYIYRELLREQGCHSVIVKTVAEALKIIDQGFDLVYVDGKKYESPANFKKIWAKKS